MPDENEKRAGGDALLRSDDAVEDAGSARGEGEFVSAVPVATVTDSMNVVVDLPEPAREIPEDERAVAIDDTTVNPGHVEVTEPATRSVDVAGVQQAQHSDSWRDSPEAVVAQAYSRRNRLHGPHGNAPETTAMLTADRLLPGGRAIHPAPEGGLNRFLYSLTFHRLNPGDSRKVRARKDLDHRIRKSFEGGTRFVPVLTRKGGVGKTTVTTLLGMALADVREDRIIAIDANPDRGTLSERVSTHVNGTVRDAVAAASSVTGYTDFSDLVSRDETRLDVLASDTDPTLSEAFDAEDYDIVADLCSTYYSIVLTDCGTGIVHSVMRATLQRADTIVVVSGGSVDEARLASETLTWLEANGYEQLVHNAVVAVNTATQGTMMVKLAEIEEHFASRVRAVVRIPYDRQLAAGSVVSYKDLRPLTKYAARTLAAHVVEGIPTARVN